MIRPKTHNENSLINALREVNCFKWFDFWRWWERDSRLDKIVNDGIGGGDVFRAFRKYPKKKKPKETIKKWANGFLNKHLLELKTINDQPKYSEWILGMGNNLRSFWKREMKQKMKFGPSSKICNLLMKKLCCSREISTTTFKKIVWYLEIPLDSYILRAIAKCPSIKIKTKISKNPTMGSIKNLSTYDEIQDGIREITSRAGVPPITFDLYAWNRPSLENEEEGGHL